MHPDDEFYDRHDRRRDWGYTDGRSMSTPEPKPDVEPEPIELVDIAGKGLGDVITDDMRAESLVGDLIAIAGGPLNGHPDQLVGDIRERVRPICTAARENKVPYDAVARVLGGTGPGNYSNFSPPWQDYLAGMLRPRP